MSASGYGLRGFSQCHESGPGGSNASKRVVDHRLGDCHHRGVVLINGSVIGGIILLVVAALVGPGGYSIFNRRAA